MLEPYFFHKITRKDSSPIPDEKVESSADYRVISYCQVDGYTIVAWEYKKGGESMTGENLFYRRNCIVSGGGQITLYQEASSAYKGGGKPSVFRNSQSSLRIKSNRYIGLYGIPLAIAIKLRNPENWISISD
jgi:hypothetical protein